MRPTTHTRSKTGNPLDRVRLTESERRAAHEYMEQGALIADLVLTTSSAIHSIAHGIQRAIRAFGRARSAG